MKPTGLIAGCILLHTLAVATVPQDLIYRKTVGQDTTLTRWQTYHADSLLVRTYQEGEQLHTTWYSGEEAVRFELSDPAEELHVVVERSGDELTLSGTHKGKSLRNTLHLNGHPWLQSMSLSLGQFVLSGASEITYSIFRIDKMKLCTLQAQITGTHELVVNGIPQLATEVQVSATGILAKLWHCTYWFRSSDGLFLRYHGVNGPPGTPVTTIELLKK
jgi:hypothetical protein